MRTVLAIAAITIRTAVRSRIVLCLLGILLAMIVGLPLTVKSDGTIEGHVQIVVGYTLGLAAALLSISTLWAGCAAVAAEIQEKQIQMLVSKPVRRGQVWLGKWTGLMALNGLMLLVSVVATYGFLRWTTHGNRITEGDRSRLERDVLVARREVRPPLPDVERQVRERYAADSQAGRIPRDMDPDTAMEALRRNFRAIEGAVQPSTIRSWKIDLPEAPGEDGEITVRFKFAVSTIERNPVAGLWFAGTPQKPDLLSIPQTNTPLAFHEMKIPAKVLRGGSTLVLSYANADNSGATVLFGEDDSLVAMVPAGSFKANLFRGSLIVLAQLAFLTALGVTAGTMFSLPVAGFMSLCALLLLFSAGFVGELASTKHIVGDARNQSAAQQVANAVLHGMYTALQAVTEPLDFESPWADVATARLVPWARVGKALAMNALVYGGALALLGAYVFNRREVALPQS